MTASLRISPELRRPVWAAFRRHCHRFVAIGYSEALSRIRRDADEETDITGYICDALEAWFKRNGKEAVGFFIKDDPPVASGGKTGKRRPRTDIIISYAAGARPEFFIEAKRLHRTKARAARYTDADGIGCFLSGRYASRYPEVAMLGYVQTGTSVEWRDTLQDRVKTNADTLRLMNIEQTMTFKEALPLEWASSHQREGLGEVKIFHLLLDCRKSDPAPR
jgi:hypothetical protein